MTGPTLTSIYNWWNRVAQHLYLQWSSQVLFMHSSRWRLLKREMSAEFQQGWGSLPVAKRMGNYATEWFLP